MGEDFNVPWVKPVRKTSHLTQEANGLGTHDRFFFTPAVECRVRCPECSRLMDSNFFDIGKCPQCLHKFTKAEARDCFVEAIYMKVNHGGWTDEVMQQISSYKYPVMLRPDGRVQPITENARKVVEYYVSKARGYAAEDNMPAELYKLRTQAMNAELNKPFMPRRL